MENNILTEDITLRQLMFVLSPHQEVEVLVEDEHVFKGPCKHLIVAAAMLKIYDHVVAEILAHDGVIEITVIDEDD